MFKKMIVLSIALFAATAQAQPCSQATLAQKAMQGALYLESLNGGGRPRTKELHSLSSQFDTYIAILSYSGVQNLWKIKVDSKLCLVESVSKLQ